MDKRDTRRSKLFSQGYREYTAETFSNRKSALRVSNKLRKDGYNAQVVPIFGIGKEPSDYIIMYTSAY